MGGGGLRLGFRSGHCKSGEKIEAAFGIMQRHGFSLGTDIIDENG